MGNVICLQTPNKAAESKKKKRSPTTRTSQKREGGALYITEEPELKKQKIERERTDFEFNEEQLINLLEAFEETALDPPLRGSLKRYRTSRQRKPEPEPKCLDFSFKKLADSDGYLNKEIMKKYLQISDAEAKTVFDYFDDNGDGKIDMSEFDTAAKTPSLKKNPWVENYLNSKVWTEDYCDRLLAKHKPAPEGRRPIFFFAYGPQGSGKTTTTTPYLEQIGASPVEINIDHITKSYAEEVLGNEAIIEDDSLYWEVRHGWPEMARYELLRRCQDGRYDLIWETTGRAPHLYKEIAKPLVNGEHHYKVICMYVLAPFSVIAGRLLRRYAETGQAFAHVRTLLKSVKDIAINHVHSWFDKPDDGAFIYFNNSGSFEDQKRIESAEELRKILEQHPFMKYVRENFQWRGVLNRHATDLSALANESRAGDIDEPFETQVRQHHMHAGVGGTTI